MLLYNRLVELYKNDTSMLSKILLMFYGIKTNFEIVNKSPSKKLKFVNQVGGEVKIFSHNKNDFYYNVEYAKPINKNYLHNEVYLLTVNEGIDDCGLILIDKERNEANIQSVSNYSDCIICKNINVKYKAVAILMQIIIHECKKLKIKKITLEDNSKKNFTGSSIELIYYRTMTQGTPYYSKFGFKNILPLKVRENENNWKQQPKIKKNQLIKILLDYTTKNDKKIIDLFNKILNKYNDNIIVSDFLIYLFGKAVKKEEEITERRNNGQTINFINSYARVLYLIIKELYIITSYKILPDNKFMLFI
jgi:hypothetical protein